MNRPEPCRVSQAAHHHPPAHPGHPAGRRRQGDRRGARSAALGLYLWLVAVTGVRRGELCGLQIRDIDLDRGLVHVASNYVVRAGQRVRKDTKTHQDRWLAIDPGTCALIADYRGEIRAEPAAVGVGLRDGAYLCSNDPAHSQPWNPDWATHKVAAAGVKLDITGGRHMNFSPKWALKT